MSQRIRQVSVSMIGIGLTIISISGYAANSDAKNGDLSIPNEHTTNTYSSSPVLPNTSLMGLQNTSYSNLPAAHASIVQASEMMATPPAKQVLRQARILSLEQRRIVSGSCWDYLNEVFVLAGVNRDTVFKGSFKAGPYVNSDELRGGDWLYFINHGYNDGEHSGLFIGWVDRALNQALILSYAGENRQEPARYSLYDVSHVYQIMRPTL